MKNENGELQSKKVIKTKIESLVRGEDGCHPLTDKVISDRLKAEGIRLSRRTVAKYRQALRILPVYLRRKVKGV